jgi:succinate dehydrogenase / fumarate reductase cytochrome b subunit
MTDQTLPKDFIWRRLHSLMGVWFALYLAFHLLTNSQAALMFGEDGIGFVKGVNAIHELPFLNVIEIAFLAVPILIHTIWGIQYLFTAKYNSFGYNGKDPYLPQYGRNRAYTWQRITAWILLVGVAAHVVHMRFIEYPAVAKEGSKSQYVVRLDEDPGLHSLKERLGYKIYTFQNVQDFEQSHNKESPYEESFVKALKEKPLKPGQILAVADNFGTTSLLMVRDTFKSPLMIALYTIFVLTACFHAFNGLWSASIKWGITLTARAQRNWLIVCQVIMAAVALLGLTAIFGTYWINLRN